MLGTDKSLLTMARKFLYSHIFLALQTAMAVYCFLSKDITLPIIFFISCMAVSLLLADDLTILFSPVALLSMAIMENTGFNVDKLFANKFFLYSLIAVFSLLFAAFILHFIIYRKNHPLRQFKAGRLLFANIAVSLALLLGGAAALGLKNYERLITLYYVLGLGVVMTLVYLLLRNYTRPYFNRSAGMVLARQMVYVCVMGVMMIAFTVIPLIVKDGTDAHWYLTWKNGFSSMLLIAMPFAFYYSLKPKHGVIYWIIANLAFFAMFFSFSRGGMIFGALEYIVCLVASVILSKGGNKIVYGVITLGIVSVLAYFAVTYNEVIKEILAEAAVESDEVRVKLYVIAIENFLKHPVFGAGMGYIGEYFHPHEMSLYWYHSTLFQVIGSMGLVGLAAYGYQLCVRCKILFSKKSLLNIFAAIAFFGYYLYQLVDVCEFVPLPWMLFTAQIFVVLEHGKDDKNVMPVKLDLMSARKYKFFKENRFL